MENRDVLDILESVYASIPDFDWSKIGYYGINPEPIQLPKSDKDEVIPVAAPE